MDNVVFGRKISLNFLLTSKYIIWGILNLYFLFRVYDLIDVLFINLMIIIIHALNKLHSVSIGMIMGSSEIKNEFKNLDFLEKFKYDKENFN